MADASMKETNGPGLDVYQDLNPAQVWARVVQAMSEEIRGLYKAATDYVSNGRPIAKLLHDAVSQLSVKRPEVVQHILHGKFKELIDESDWIAGQLDVNPLLMALLQRIYSWAHIPHGSGCSTAMTWDSCAGEMVQVRSLDWSMSPEAIARASVVFRLKAGGNDVAQVAGIAGMVGFLTGVRRRFSVAINYAPGHSVLPLAEEFLQSIRGHDPTFLLRELIQNDNPELDGHDGYSAAAAMIERWNLSTPVFISLCGTRKGEAMVFEFSYNGIIYNRRAESGEQELSCSNQPFLVHGSNAVQGQSSQLRLEYN